MTKLIDKMDWGEGPGSTAQNDSIGITACVDLDRTSMEVEIIKCMVGFIASRTSSRHPVSGASRRAVG